MVGRGGVVVGIDGVGVVGGEWWEVEWWRGEWWWEMVVKEWW